MSEGIIEEKRVVDDSFPPCYHLLQSCTADDVVRHSIRSAYGGLGVRSQCLRFERSG